MNSYNKLQETILTKYKIKKKQDIIAENTAKMSLFAKNIIDIIAKS